MAPYGGSALVFALVFTVFTCLLVRVAGVSLSTKLHVLSVISVSASVILEQCSQLVCSAKQV